MDEDDWYMRSPDRQSFPTKKLPRHFDRDLCMHPNAQKDVEDSPGFEDDWYMRSPDRQSFSTEKLPRHFDIDPNLHPDVQKDVIPEAVPASKKSKSRLNRVSLPDLQPSKKQHSYLNMFKRVHRGPSVTSVDSWLDSSPKEEKGWRRLFEQEDPQKVSRVASLRAKSTVSMVREPHPRAQFHFYSYFVAVYVVLFAFSFILLFFTDFLYPKPTMRDPKGALWSLDPFFMMFFLSFLVATVIFVILLLGYVIIFLS